MKCTDSTEIKLNEMCFIVLFLESGLSRSVIEKAVIEAKATVDAAYQYSRREWVYTHALRHIAYEETTYIICTNDTGDILNGDNDKSDLHTTQEH